MPQKLSASDRQDDAALAAIQNTRIKWSAMTADQKAAKMSELEPGSVYCIVTLSDNRPVRVHPYFRNEKDKTDAEVANVMIYAADRVLHLLRKDGDYVNPVIEFIDCVNRQAFSVSVAMTPIIEKAAAGEKAAKPVKKTLADIL